METMDCSVEDVTEEYVVIIDNFISEETSDVFIVEHQVKEFI